MAITTIKIYKPWALVLHLLIENVGPMLHSKPIIFWHGSGWHMTRHREITTRGQIGKQYCIIEFDKEADAVWFSLRWL